MATSTNEEKTPLIGQGDCSVVCKDRPVLKPSSGGWRSAAFILGVEVAESFSYYGIASNLKTFLTGSLGESTATAAETVNLWSGASMLLPLLGGIVADSLFGRYRTILIVIASIVYILGSGLLSLLAVLTSGSSFPSKFHVILFYLALLLLAIGHGGRKPCVQAFGAGMFDGEDDSDGNDSDGSESDGNDSDGSDSDGSESDGKDSEDDSDEKNSEDDLEDEFDRKDSEKDLEDEFDGKDNKSKSSFFNWWYFSSNVGILVKRSVLAHIQDNLSWAFGFGIPCIVMVAWLFFSWLRSRDSNKTNKKNPSSKKKKKNTSSKKKKKDPSSKKKKNPSSEKKKKKNPSSKKKKKKNPFVRIGRVFVAAVKNRKITPTAKAPEEDGCGCLPPHLSQEFKCLDKALHEKVCCPCEVEEAKAVLRLVPIWVSCLGYAVVFAQSSTFFTKQGVTMDRAINLNFRIPAASLQSFIPIAIILIVPLYDQIFVRITRAKTRKPSGVTMLQRIGIGMVLSAVSMVIAALVEMKRLRTAEENGLVDKPNATIPMSIWWLVPQHILFGASDVFTMVGLQEFFYDQVPVDLRSTGFNLYHGIFHVGDILSSLVISAIDKASNDTWFSDNLNQAHLDYFYWLLAGLGAAGLASFLYFAKSYIYKGKSKG